MFPQGMMAPHAYGQGASSDDFPALRAAPKVSHGVATHVGTIAPRTQAPGRMHQNPPGARPPPGGNALMYKGHQTAMSSIPHVSPAMHSGLMPMSGPMPMPPPPMYSNQSPGFASGVALGSSSGPVTSSKTEFSKKSRKERETFGLLGILKVIRMTDPDLSTLALGLDLTTLGLNLNSPECLYTSFASPWSEVPARKDPEYYLPQCYYMQPPQLKAVHLQKFTLETLCYIFHHMPGDMLQAYVAQELYNRKWFFHSELKSWFEKSDDPSKAPWSYFDPDLWEKRDYWEQLDESKFLSETDVRIPRDTGPKS